MTRAFSMLVLAVCGTTSCSGAAIGADDAPPDAGRDTGSNHDARVSAVHRGFVGVAQTYPDQKNGPMANAYQHFILEDLCVSQPGSEGCTVTATPNECGGMTFTGTGWFGRVHGDDLVEFYWPFVGGHLPRKLFSAGEVHIEGQRDRMTLSPNEILSTAAVVFEPLERLRASAMGDVVPPFATEVQMPSRAVFSMPDLTSSELVLGNAPIEVAWTAEGSVGTVEVWSAVAFTPDGYSSIMVVHCSAPLGAGHLTVPSLGSGSGTSPFITRALSIRVENTERLHAGSWDLQVTAASFDSGPVMVVNPPATDGAGSD
jgi:hypothetical protein